MKDIFSIKGKVALVTGGSRGIGSMIAAGFLSSGAKVYISSRKAGACDETAKKLSEEYGGECISIPADVSNVEGIEALADAIKAKEDKLDILINNAGSISTSLFLTSKIEDIKDLFQVNFFSQLTLTQILVKKMINKNKSSIINITSTAGIDAVEGRLAYASTKSSMIIATKILAKHDENYMPPNKNISSIYDS